MNLIIEASKTIIFGIVGMCFGILSCRSRNSLSTRIIKGIIGMIAGSLIGSTVIGVLSIIEVGENLPAYMSIGSMVGALVGAIFGTRQNLVNEW